MRNILVKKICLYALSLVLLLTAVKFSGAAQIALGKSNSANVDGNLLYMYHSGYLKEPNRALLFKSYNQLVTYYQTYKIKYYFDSAPAYYGGTSINANKIQSFKDMVINGYDENWFKDYDLVLYVSYEGSGSYYYRLKSIDYVMTTAKIVLYRQSPYYTDCAMAGWHTFIEIEKKSHILTAEVSIINK